MAATESGPYLVAALICERILTEKDNVQSLIRIIDRTTVSTAGPQSNLPMPKISRDLSMLISLKSGSARGPEVVKVTLTRPSGLTDPEPLWEQSVHLQGGVHGNNLVLIMQVVFDEPGPYWFNVYLDDRLSTKTPFEIRHTHTRTSQ